MYVCMCVCMYECMYVCACVDVYQSVWAGRDSAVVHSGVSPSRTAAGV